MDFQPQFMLAGVFPSLARGVVRVMPSQLRKGRRIGGLGLWASEKKLKEYFDDTEQNNDRHTHWVAIQGASAMLTRLHVPCPPVAAGPEIWRAFLAHIVAAASDGDITGSRSVMNKAEWASIDDYSGFGAPSPSPPTVGHQPGPPGVSIEERVFIPRTAGEIFQAVGPLTDIGVEQYANPLLGKWLRVQSQVRNMAQDPNFFYVMLGRKFDQMPYLRFRKAQWGGHIEVLAQGNRLAAIGKITKIDQMTIYMDECEAVELEGEDDTLRLPS